MLCLPLGVKLTWHRKSKFSCGFLQLQNVWFGALKIVNCLRLINVIEITIRAVGEDEWW
jgi:hypothetical protein